MLDFIITNFMAWFSCIQHAFGWLEMLRACSNSMLICFCAGFVTKRICCHLVRPHRKRYEQTVGQCKRCETQCGGVWAHCAKGTTGREKHLEPQIFCSYRWWQLGVERGGSTCTTCPARCEIVFYVVDIIVHEHHPWFKRSYVCSCGHSFNKFCKLVQISRIIHLFESSSVGCSLTSV